jgi:hypothetical protein
MDRSKRQPNLAELFLVITLIALAAISELPAEEDKAQDRASRIAAAINGCH